VIGNDIDVDSNKRKSQKGLYSIALLGLMGTVVLLPTFLVLVFFFGLVFRENVSKNDK